MELIKTEDVIKATHIKNLGGEGTAKLIMSVLKLNEINRIYEYNSFKPAYEFLDSVLKETDIKYEIPETDLAKIPVKGPFIIVANHPYGGIEGMILLHALLKIRPDLKIMGNFLLQRIEPIKKYVIPVNPFETYKDVRSSYSGIKDSVRHVEEGKALAIFPAGEVSTYSPGNPAITDRRWDKSVIKLIKKAKVPVVPIFFSGNNSPLFHWLGWIHPLLRTARIPSELLNKKKQTVLIRIGKQIPITEQDLFTDVSGFGRYLRAKTYALGTSLKVNEYYKRPLFRPAKPEKIIDAVNKDVLINEIKRIPVKYELFTYRNYSIFCVPTFYIPHIMLEIGRLREITFREVSEGSNLEKDIDEFDLYYRQLFIWDNENSKIAGGYRVGLGREILSGFGFKGLYTRTLFKMDKKMRPVLEQSIELGRSFIVNEYQRKPLSLFLLWKGVLYFLLKHEEYRFLVGPVSISNRFSNLSKQMIIDYVSRHYLHTEFSKMIKPRKPFVAEDKNADMEVLTENILNVEELDIMVRDIEIYQTRLPVLLKKYLMLGGKIAAFNIDPAFNNALDGLMFLDLFDVPHDVIAALSKELNDENVLKRFKLQN